MFFFIAIKISFSLYSVLKAKHYVKSFDDMTNRAPGKTTGNSINMLDLGSPWNKVLHNIANANILLICVFLRYHTTQKGEGAERQCAQCVLDWFFMASLRFLHFLPSFI